MDEIATKRAEMKNDCREWSAKDALEDSIRRIGDKKVRLAVHWLEENEDGSQQHHSAAAGITIPEHIALLEIAKLETIENWKA